MLSKKSLSTVLLLITLHLSAFAQTVLSEVSGTVTNEQGEPVTGAYVYLDKTSFVGATDAKGHFQLKAPAGQYTLICSMMGYGRESRPIHVREGHKLNHNFVLKPSKDLDLTEVKVMGKTQIAELRESPYNVVALDAKAFFNTTLDLGHLLDKASGVKIRETGGVGSDVSVTLNGFTGRHVKIFMDGVPMEGFGSAFQLNNIPVNIANRIEVYKGVVPIEFGADAMGGVINIVTNQSANTYADVSYSYGSFNTHKTNISLGHTTRSGFTFQLNAFQNYSDNSYKVRTNVLNLQTGNFSNEEQWVRRFNGAYQNETIMAKVGFVNKPWADRLLLGITLGKERSEIQNSNLMKIVFGKRERRGTTVLPSLTYAKRNLIIRNLNASLTANYNKNYNQNIDTAARQYNWLGEYRITRSIGESVYSLGKFYNTNGSTTANLTYNIGEDHSFGVSNVLSGYSRRNADAIAMLDVVTAADTIRRTSVKNVFGASYRYQHKRNWNATVFTKLYNQRVTGPVDTARLAGNSSYAEQQRQFQTMGYGIAGTYFLKAFQIKASAEKAYRLPTDNELFGDEVLETGNATLRAENSINYNLGLRYNKQVYENHSFYVDAGFYYRDINDYIRRQIEQRYGTAGYTNHGKVRNIGMDAELRYYYKNRFSVGGNITYQDMRNRERFVSATSTQRSVTYNDRIPNVPYFFGNADASLFLTDIGGKGNVLSLGYTVNFVERFFLIWESLGSSSTKNELPRQLYHDFNATYTLKNGRYNVALEARNFTNALLYDNFSLQKPGRFLSMKVRYFFVKSNK